uniref:Uncharacterized protein n=1 Tax=Acrobeloides nanus TaxID=290746 RepID=A0A914CZB3_9BILA
MCANDGYCYDETRIFIGFVWNNGSTGLLYTDVDVYNIRDMLKGYLTDSSSIAKIQKINIIIADTNGVMCTCNNTDDCINYLQETFAHDLTSRIFNPNDSLAAIANQFFEPSSNTTLNMAYIFALMFQCESFSQSNFLEMMVNDSDKMISMVNEKRIYTKFMNAITTLETDQSCQLMSLLENASNYFQVIYNKILNAMSIKDFPSISFSDFSIFRNLYSNEAQCEYVGYHPEINVPKCQTWAFHFGLFLDSNKLSLDEFEDLKKSIVQLIEPCGERDMNTTIVTTGTYSMLHCRLYTQCKEAIMGLTIDQVTSNGSQILTYKVLMYMFELFGSVMKYDTRAIYFISNLDCDKISSIIFSGFKTWEREMYSFGVLLKQFRLIFPIVVFNQSIEQQPLCNKSMESLILNGREFVQLYILGENDTLTDLVEPLKLCQNYGDLTSELWQTHIKRA